MTRKSPYINLYEEFFTSQLSKSRIGERKTTKKDDFFKTNNDEIDFISMMEKHFDCVWEVADREIDRKQEIKNTNFEVKS